MNSRVAETPIGIVLVKGWPNVRCSQDAACPAISGYSTTLKSASPSLARSAGVAPIGAVTLTSMPSLASSAVISVTSSRWRKPSAVGPSRLQRGRAPAARCGALGARRRRRRSGQRAHQLIERLGRAPVLLALIGRQIDGHHRNRQIERARQTAGIVLDQRAGAGRADDHRLRLEPVIGVLRRGLEQFGGIAAEIARGEGRVGHRRPPVAALDHREQQIRVGVALRRMQHVMQALHPRRDAHRADMGRSFICPHRELHGQATSFARRTSGRANNSARSAACS